MITSELMGVDMGVGSKRHKWLGNEMVTTAAQFAHAHSLHNRNFTSF